MKRTIAVTILCVAMMLMGAHVRADDAQSRCTRIANNWVTFWNAKDTSTAFDVFTEDIVYEDVPTHTVVAGKDDFLAFAQGFFQLFPNRNSIFTLVNSSCSGQQGFIEWSWSAVDNPGFFGTGKSVTGRGVAIIEIHGNRISRNTDYWDCAALLTQLGQPLPSTLCPGP